MIAPAHFDTAQALDRVLLLSELLQRSIGPVCAGSLALTIAERMNRAPSKRTILRDLRALHRRGLVELNGDGKRGSTLLWRWAGAATLRPTA